MACRSSGACSMAQPMRAPTAAASRIAAEQKARTSGSARMRSAVAPVIAETGFSVMLPHSLNQMARRISVDTVALSPACMIQRARRSTRSEPPPPGSPMMSSSPVRCSTTPCVSTEADRCTTQPSTFANGIAAPMVPPGSTLASGCAASSGTPRPNHHGTPFIAGSTMVCAPISGASKGAMAASEVALTATTTRSCTPSSRASATARTGACSTPCAERTRKPCSRNVASVAPRATTLTSKPPLAAKRAPSRPPMAPAP